MTKEALIKSQNPFAWEIDDDTPLYHNENLETGRESKIQELFEHFCFYPAYFDKYQCKPEVILLALSCFEYLYNYEKPEDRNCPTVQFLIRQLFCDNLSYESNMDKLFKEIHKEEPNARCVEHYQMFHEANNSKKRDAIVALYEYYACGVYTIKEITESPSGVAYKLKKRAETRNNILGEEEKLAKDLDTEIACLFEDEDNES